MKMSGVPVPQIPFSPKHYYCQRAVTKPHLDGRLDKPFWANVPWTEEFVDIEGDLKPLPTKQTRVKMQWDDEYMYFGAELVEDEIWATLTERDSVIFYDNDFEIFIDPDGDSHQYYEFEMNALNTVWDLMLVKPYRDGGPPVNSWDIQGLQTAVHIDGELNNPSANNRKWTLEVAMPWKTLKECAADGRAPLTGEYWRVNFSRVQWTVDVVDGAYVKRKDTETGRPLPEDNWVWSPMGIVNMHYPELWGYVVFVDKANSHKEFVPHPDERLKWQLRQVYYRQRNYYEEHGKYCPDLQLLVSDDPWNEDIQLETTSVGFHAQVLSSDRDSHIHIREDGLTWKD
ncbi:carbohydrate-binding family 9-like protein [Paenibacillus sp. Marseille-Q4541]|uniref:carbohydrate-binding family 9-like protein n=1 Tax=Paenibacillus sp. Marseille-Q4541 TaxID=2831522 RepID=UPI001BA61BDF|nr:carbohydrate-binding family 9-like protein [Paenibacillus sp. Marseille-Q4541]